MPSTRESTVGGASGYRLRKPCAHCPFRNDIKPYLRPGRVSEIAGNLLAGGSFVCHETTVPTDTDDTEMTPGPKAQACAGSLIITERTTGDPGQLARIAERLGLRDDRIDAADPAHPVYPDLTSWVRAHDPDSPPTVTTGGGTTEYAHCGVVDVGCDDPAGLMTRGVAIDNPDPAACDPLTDYCAVCDVVCCRNCRTPDPDEPGMYLCVDCG